MRNEIFVGSRPTSELIRKKHNVSVLLYHLVCPTKYRKAVLTPDVDEKLKEICKEISLRYEIEFLEIGTDSEHVHFFVQSVPTYSPRANDAFSRQVNNDLMTKKVRIDSFFDP